MTVVSLTQPDNGTAVVVDDQSVRYTPDAAFNGTDTFDYVVSDGRDTATVTVSVGEIAAPAPPTGLVVQ